LITALQRNTVIAIPRSAPPPPPVTLDDLVEWFTAPLPDDWFDAIDITVDDDEILVTGRLGEPRAGLSAVEQIGAFREATREARMDVADQAQQRFRRKVSWGAECADLDARFTHLTVPAMTRLRIEERQILDTLIAGGVARSRSEALAWCVRLVADHEAEWLDELRDATAAIDDVRRRGPAQPPT